MLQLAGVDTSQFKGHPTRGAAASAASRAKVPLEVILATANWSSADTFLRFYKKPLSSVESSACFAEAVLNASS